MGDLSGYLKIYSDEKGTPVTTTLGLNGAEIRALQSDESSA
jgi:hypothetical protein